MSSYSAPRLFLYGYLLWMTAGLLLLSLTEKGTLCRWMALHRFPAADWLFYLLTSLGNGWIVVLIGLILIRRYALPVLTIGLLQLCLTALCKRWIFGNRPRPLRFFSEENLPLVEGVQVFGNHSFPSGHSVTVFGMAMLLVLIDRRPLRALLLLAVAVLSAISRVYLFQHFLEDILAGSALGVGISLLVWWVWAGIRIKGSLNKLTRRAASPYL